MKSATYVNVLDHAGDDVVGQFKGPPGAVHPLHLAAARKEPRPPEMMSLAIDAVRLSRVSFFSSITHAVMAVVPVNLPVNHLSEPTCATPRWAERRVPLGEGVATEGKISGQRSHRRQEGGPSPIGLAPAR